LESPCGSGRLIIAGKAGAGKSSAALLLVLAALTHREQVPEELRGSVPVPVMLTLSGWNPDSQPILDWLAKRLQQTYSLLEGRNGISAAATLIAAGKIAIILDGFDELPEAVQPVALEALNQQASFRLIILTRITEMAAATTQGVLDGAAAIELKDVTPASAASYLERVQRHPPPRGWRTLTNHIRFTPDSPISQALNTPLTLTLVRDTYRRGDDVNELLDFCNSPDHQVTKLEITDHLLDRVLLAAYVQRPGATPPPYDLPTAENALRKLAVRMNQDSTRELQWWRIPEWFRTSSHLLASCVASVLLGVVTGVLAGVVAGILVGLAVSIFTSIYVGLMGASIGIPRQIRLPDRRRFLQPGPLAICVLYGVGLGGIAGPTAGAAIGAVIGLVIGTVSGYIFALGQSGTNVRNPLPPLSLWRNDWIYWLCCGLFFGVLAGSYSA